MATSSILKNVKIETKEEAKMFIQALDASSSDFKNRPIKTKFKTVTAPKEIKNMFSKKI